jgi:DNA-binding NarL/FixJ family response regulator
LNVFLEDFMPATHARSILIADDHILIAEAFRKLLGNEFNVVAIVHDGHTLIQTAQKLRPDAILVDIGMPFLNGFEAGRRIKRLLPSTHVIYVTINADPDLVIEAFRQGASGYLTKTAAPTELVTAVREAVSGGLYLSTQLRNAVGHVPGASPELIPPRAKLTDRQTEVLQLLAEGKSMKETGALLNLTARTVAFHKYRIMEKLRLGTDSDVVQYAMRHHVVFG